MQLSQQTIKILENFAGINGGIVIRKTPTGKKKTQLKTTDRDGTVYAQVEIDEVFPTNVCLHDVKSFLSIYNGLEDPVLDLQDKKVVVQSGKNIAHITYSDPRHVIHPEQEFDPPASDHKFPIEQDDIVNLLNMGNILNLPHLRIFTKDGDIIAQATNAGDPNTSTFDIKLGKAKGQFDVYISRDNIKMLPGDYDVEIVSGQFALFTNAVNKTLQYCTGLEIL